MGLSIFGTPLLAFHSSDVSAGMDLGLLCDVLTGTFPGDDGKPTGGNGVTVTARDADGAVRLATDFSGMEMPSIVF